MDSQLKKRRKGVEEVVNLCSFETLKNLEANKGEKDREGTEGRECWDKLEVSLSFKLS